MSGRDSRRSQHSFNLIANAVIQIGLRDFNNFIVGIPGFSLENAAELRANTENRGGVIIASRIE